MTLAIPDDDGDLPIHIACLNRQFKCTQVSYLLNNTVTQNSRGQYGSTPLHIACQNGHMDLIQYLTTELEL